MSREEAINNVSTLSRIMGYIDSSIEFAKYPPDYGVGSLEQALKLLGSMKQSLLEAPTKPADKSEPESNCKTCINNSFCKWPNPNCIGRDASQYKPFDKSEAGEFTKAQRDIYGKSCVDDGLPESKIDGYASLRRRLLEACDRIDRLRAENKKWREKTYCETESGGILCVELEATNRKLQNELEAAEGENDNLIAKDRNLFENDAIIYRKEIKHLQNELEAAEGEIKRLQPFDRFYHHIKEHLELHEKVICKICGISLDDIEQALKGDETAKSLTRQIMELRDEVSKLRKLIIAQEEYISLLGEELDETVAFSYTHGWKSTRFEKGKKLRARIEALKGDDDVLPKMQRKNKSNR